MAFYQYKAMDANGRVIQAEVEAEHLQDLEMRLRGMKLDLINARIKRRSLFTITRKHTRQDLINFCFYLEQLLRAGVPLLEALNDLAQSLEKGHPFQRIVAGLVDHIESGKHFSRALEEYPAVFSESFIALIRAGEESGEMDKVLADLTESLKWQDELYAQTKKAITTPAFMMVVVIALVFFMMLYLVPQMTEFIVSMGQELPMHTLALIAVSDFFVNNWLVLLLVPVALFIAAKQAIKHNAAAALKADRFKLRLPIIGAVIQKLLLARFASYFALLYSAGIPILRCMEISRDIVANKSISLALLHAQDDIMTGQSIHQALEASDIFPALVIRMIRVGELSGELDKSLENVAYFYKREVDDAIENLQALVQPVITTIMGFFIGWIMLSVLGPIYDLMSQIEI
jgi:type IV pilus assembly protein PilC